MKKIKIGIKLQEWQEDIWTQISLAHTRFVSLSVGRRAGKSYLMNYTAIRLALESKKRVLFTTPEFKLAGLFYKALYLAFKDSGALADSSSADFSLTFLTGGYIQFFSSKNPDAVRGNKFDVLIADEAAFQSDYFITECCLPCLATCNDPKVILVSTPLLDSGFFYEMFNKKGVGYYSFTAPSSISKYVNNEYLGLMRDTLSDKAYKREILAQFLKAGDNGLFKFKYELSPSKTDKLYAGLDIGFNDSTVLTILNDKGELLEQFEWEKLEYNKLLDEVTKVLNEYKPVKTLIEKNGVGKPFTDFLRSNGVKFDEWVTTNKSKLDIIEALIKASETGECKIQPINELMNQLDLYAVEELKTGYTYNASKGKDDRVMSLALAYKALNKKKGVYNICGTR